MPVVGPESLFLSNMLITLVVERFEFQLMDINFYSSGSQGVIFVF
jgi:hypothetical protein